MVRYLSGNSFLFLLKKLSMLSMSLSVLMCEYIETESAVNSFVLGEKYLFSGLGIVFNDCIRLV